MKVLRSKWAWSLQSNVGHLKLLTQAMSEVRIDSTLFRTKVY